MPRPPFVDKYKSNANRQDLPYQSPMQSYFEAKAECQDMKDQERQAAKLAGTPYETILGTPLNQADLDRAIQLQQRKDDYLRHFTDFRGTGTISRDNIVDKKL